MYNNYGTPIIDNCIFQGNNARGPLHGFLFTNGYGGGMYNLNSSPTLSICIFSENSATYGGGMYNDGGAPIMDNCIFQGNNTDSALPSLMGGGGGVYNNFSSSTVTNCIFSKNSAYSGGGGMFNGSGTITNCTFTGNMVTAIGSGGGLSNGSGTVTHCTFNGNSADLIGGGLSNATGTITGCTFSNNSAYSGGGMCSGWMSSSSGGTVTDCTFNGNSSDRDGGGMCIADSSTVTNCMFIGNSAGQWGGGMNCKTSCIPNCGDGPILINCAFIGNFADDSGGGINSNGSNPIITNCTFADNSATTGNAIVCNSYSQGNPSTVQVHNSILWDGGDEIWNNDNSIITITYSDVQGSYPGLGNIDDNPLFVDPNGLDGIIGTEDDNLRLSLWSPCIDVGDNSVVDANCPDLDGNQRIVDGDGDGLAIVDMGAYEALLSIEADVHIVPRVINRNNHLKRVFAVVRLPEGIGRHDVSDEPFVLYPDGSTDGIEAIWQRVVGWGNRISVFAIFSKDELMELVSDSGPVELTVTGKLESGQYIYGSDTVRILQPRRWRPRRGWLRRRR
jgi:hypothetical protein